jgi:hypothetical protein
MYISSFLALLISYYTLSVLGKFLDKLVFPSQFTGFASVFYHLFLGLFSTVTIFSIVSTGGETINVLLLLAALIVVIMNLTNKNLIWFSSGSAKWSSIFKIDKYFLYSMIPLVLFFGWRTYTLFDPNSEYPISINMDSMKHVIRAYFISSTGVESINVNYVHLPHGLDPYHYFEAWTIAAFGTVFKSNYWEIEQLVVYPFFSSVIVVGFWGLLQKVAKQWWIYALGFVVVQFSGFYVELLEKVKYMTYSEGYGMNAFDEWKGFTISVTYMVILMFFNYLLTYKDPLKALLLLLILPIISITLLPGIFTIVFLMLLLLVIFGKNIGKSVSFWNLIFPFLIIGMIMCFYHLFEPADVIIEKPGVLDSLKRLFTITRLKLSFLLVAEKVIQGVVLFSPYIFVISWFLIAKRKELFQQLGTNSIFKFLSAFMLVGWGVSSFYWMLFYGFFGSGQFYFYTFIPFLNILVLWLILYSLGNYRKAVFRIIGVLVVLVGISFCWYRTNQIYVQSKKSLYNKYSGDYRTQVIDYLGAKNITKGFKIVDPKRFVKFDENDHLVGGFLPGIIPNLSLYSITYAEMHFKKEYPSWQAEIMLPFSGIAVHSRYLERESNSLEVAIKDLIEEYDFSCVFVDENEILPGYLQHHFKHVSTDSSSGEQFFVLK